MEPKPQDVSIHRNVSIMAIGNVLSTSANTLWIMFMPYYFLTVGFQELMIGVIFSIIAVTRAINSLIGGRVADKAGRKPVILLGYTIFCSGPMIILLSVFLLEQGSVIAGVVAVLGLTLGLMGGGLSRPASSILLVESSKKKKRGLTYMVVSRVLPSIPPAVLIIIGWWLYENQMFWLALLIGSIGILIVVMIFAIGLNETLTIIDKPVRQKPSFKSDSGLWFLVLLAAAFALDGISSSGLSWYVPLFVIDGSIYALMISISTLVIAGAALAAGLLVDKVGARSAIVVGWTVLAITVALFPHALLPLELVVLYSIWAGLDMVDISIPALVIAERFPKDERASVLGSFSMTISLTGTVGPILIAFALLLGDNVPFYLKAVMNIAGVILFLLATRNQIDEKESVNDIVHSF
ncbi:MAG: MFS transporter [Candidatus Thorarchaeota archaeon]